MNAVIRLRHSLVEYPKMLWLLAVGSFLNIAGLSFLWPINSIYIHQELGKPLTVAGLVLLLNSAGASVGQLTGGLLYDRVGARPVLLTGLVTAAAVIALPAFFESWPLYVTVMILFGFFASLVFPAMNALAARIWPAGGRRAFNFLYVANNLGVAFGTAVGGLMAARSFRLAFLAAAVMLLAFAVWAFLRIDDRAAGPAADTKPAAGEAAAAEEGPVPWLPVGALFAGLLTCWLVYVQWQGPVSVRMQALGIDLAAYSVLWTLNGLLIFAGQPLLSYAVRIFRSLPSQLFVGTLLYAGAFGLLLLSQNYSVFVVSMVVLTFGEMFLWPGIPAAVAELSPPSRRGALQGFIGAAATAGRMLGPLFGGLLYDNFSFATLLAVMIALLSVPLLSFAVYASSRRT